MLFYSRSQKQSFMPPFEHIIPGIGIHCRRHIHTLTFTQGIRSRSHRQHRILINCSCQTQSRRSACTGNRTGIYTGCCSRYIRQNQSLRITHLPSVRPFPTIHQISRLRTTGRTQCSRIRISRTDTKENLLISRYLIKIPYVQTDSSLRPSAATGYRTNISPGILKRHGIIHQRRIP